MIIKLKKYFWLLSFLFLFSPLVLQAAGVSGLQINYDPAAFTAAVDLDISTGAPTTGLPWEWESLSPVYDYSFSTTGLYDPSRPLTIKISYSANNNHLKKIFFYDSASKTWQAVPTQDFPQEKYVSAITHSTAGKIIVLFNEDILSSGTASWYKYKNGLFAASPDFAKGSVLRVYNLDNDKYVDVTVNDWGPERDKHPDRVVDLDYVAFSRLASPGAGLIKVKIEPLKIVVSTNVEKTPQISDELNLTASSAVLIFEKDEKILWDKNKNKISPLASLTKLVAAKVFLNTKPDLKKVVSYKYQDEKYNYEYCQPWESARLTVKEGETMTIENLLYSALVGSANNAVESLVRVSGLSRNEFIARMNADVEKWGASSTHFIEPTGLSAKNVSSPLDYAIITKEVFTDSLLKTISATLRYSFTTINTKKKHTLTNTNQLLQKNTYTIVGSKTGYLDEAGHCLMTRVATPQGNIIAVNFGSTSKANNFLDNEQLIRYGLRLLKK